MIDTEAKYYGVWGINVIKLSFLLSHSIYYIENREGEINQLGQDDMDTPIIVFIDIKSLASVDVVKNNSKGFRTYSMNFLF